MTYFLDTDYCQEKKHTQRVAGDVFLSKRIEDERVITVLADGLGSGVEANVLASLTATMGLEYVLGKIDTARAAEIMMDALPICRQRGISYSTFTLVDTSTDGQTRIIEHGNPAFLLIREGRCIDIPTKIITRPRWKGRQLCCAQFSTQHGDRIIVYSDGVSQSGIGTPQYPFGWGVEKVKEFLETQIQLDPEISARQLSAELVAQAVYNDGRQAGDDMSCGVIHFRHPRHLRVLTGPPFDMERDRDFAHLLTGPESKAVCGGTTSNIVARELGKELTMDLSEWDPDVPNISHMEGIDLVTEGCLTLSKVAELLESGEKPLRSNGATKLLQLFLRHDIIEFVMGTRINEAHQNPSFPVELDIRRNLLKKIIRLLESKHLKSTRLSYF